MDYRKDKSAPLFGVPLSEVVARTGHGTNVPSVISQAIRFLTTNGLNTEGLFRTPANATELHALRKAFDADPFHPISPSENPHVVAGLIKLFFRELPEPLLTFDLYHDWIDALRPEEHYEKIRRIQSVVNQLPAVNRDLLDALIVALRQVQARSNTNKMTPHNLAVVIGPNIFYPREVGLQVEHTQQIRELVQHLITDYDHIFSEHTASPSPHIRVNDGFTGSGGGSTSPSRLSVNPHLERPITPTTPTTPRLSARQQSKLNSLLDQTTSTFFNFSMALTETLEFVKSSTSHVRSIQDQRNRLENGFGPVQPAPPSRTIAHVTDAAPRSPVRQSPRSASRKTSWDEVSSTTTVQPSRTTPRSLGQPTVEEPETPQQLVMDPGRVLARFELFLGRLPELRELMSKQRTSHNPLLPASSSPPGTLKWLKPSEQADVTTEYMYLYNALADWETDWIQRYGHGPMVRDKQISGVYSLYTSLQALHMVLSTTTDTQIDAVYSGPFSRAHYAHVKQERTKDGEEESPLARAMARLEMDREANGRPANTVVMTLEQMRSEKHAVKKELKAFDAEFLRLHDRECTKAEKEPMRPLYKRYKELKDLIDAREKAEIRRPRGSTPGGISSAGTGAAQPEPPQASPKEGPQSARGVRKQAGMATGSSRPSSSPGGSREPVARTGFQGSQPLTYGGGGGGTPGPASGGSSARAATGAPTRDLAVTGVSASRGGTSAGVGDEGRAGKGPASLSSLKSEKRALQAKLQRYQQDFIKQHGRKVKYRADRLPVEAEYDRYKKVKSLIAEMEGK